MRVIEIKIKQEQKDVHHSVESALVSCPNHFPNYVFYYQNLRGFKTGNLSISSQYNCNTKFSDKKHKDNISSDETEKFHRF